MPKKIKSQFPDVLYIVYEPNDGTLVASPDMVDHAWPKEVIRVGVYRLEKVGDLTAEPVIVDLKKLP